MEHYVNCSGDYTTARQSLENRDQALLSCAPMATPSFTSTDSLVPGARRTSQLNYSSVLLPPQHSLSCLTGAQQAVQPDLQHGWLHTHTCHSLVPSGLVSPLILPGYCYYLCLWPADVGDLSKCQLGETPRQLGMARCYPEEPVTSDGTITVQLNSVAQPGMHVMIKK